MSRLDAAPVINRVVVVDDEVDSRSLIASELRRAGFEALFPRHDHYNSAETLAQEIAELGDAAICDHRLREGDLATFFGSELVATLYRRHIPAVLMTEYAKDDSAVTIRKHRRWIPSLLRTSDASPSAIRFGIYMVVREIRGEISPERKAYRAVVLIDSVNNINGVPVVKAHVPQWDPDQVVQFPLSLVPPAMQHEVGSGSAYIANVNLGAEKQEDLFFETFSPAEEPFSHE